MRKILASWPRAVLIASGCLIAAAAAAIPFVVGAGNDAIALSTVPSTRLAQEGLYLRQPTNSSSITQLGAVHVATQLFPGAVAKESVLANVVDAHVPSINGKTFWIVSVAVTGGFYPPSAGPAGSQRTEQPASYLLIFIDPRNGQFIFGDSGS